MSYAPTAPGSRAPSMTFAHDAEKIMRHEEYYLTSGDIIFLAENYLFRVHKYFFERESPYWRARFSAPTPPGQEPKGASDHNPWPLKDVRALDLARFLWIFYNHEYSVFEADADEWISILRLACEWGFEKIKVFAVRNLDPKFNEPLEKIQLYHRYQIDKMLLIPSYMAMALRAAPLSLAEGRLLGLETALAIARAREFARGLRPGKDGRREPAKVALDAPRMDELVREIFLAPSEEPEAVPARPAAANATSHYAVAHSHVPESPAHTHQQYQSQYQQPQPHHHAPDASSAFFAPPPQQPQSQYPSRDLSQIWGNGSASSAPTGSGFNPSMHGASYAPAAEYTERSPEPESEPATPAAAHAELHARTRTPSDIPYGAAPLAPDLAAAEEGAPPAAEEDSWFGLPGSKKKKGTPKKAGAR